MREITLGMCHGCKNGFGQFAQPTDRFRPPDKVASEAKFAHRPKLQYSRDRLMHIRIRTKMCYSNLRLQRHISDGFKLLQNLN